MRKFSIFLAFAAFFFADWALANAVVTSVSGAVQATVGTSAPRLLRQGDEVGQGTTVSTGPASSVVLKFDDGQVAALTANSRMVISAYQYEPASGKGSILLSLIDGGMRAITGLIGRNSPERVTYRAATATIGIRGTDVTIVTSQGDVVVSVNDGVISFTFNDKTIFISAGQAAFARSNGQVIQGTITQIQAALQGTPTGQAILNALGGISGLSAAINAAAPGAPRQGPADGTGTGTGTTPQTGGGTTGGGGGGGTASPS